MVCGREKVQCVCCPARQAGAASALGRKMLRALFCYVIPESSRTGCCRAIVLVVMRSEWRESNIAPLHQHPQVVAHGSHGYCPMQRMSLYMPCHALYRHGVTALVTKEICCISP